MINKNIYIYKYAPCLSADTNLTEVNTTAYPLCNQTTTRTVLVTKVSLNNLAQVNSQTSGVQDNSRNSFIYNWFYFLTTLYFMLLFSI